MLLPTGRRTQASPKTPAQMHRRFVDTAPARRPAHAVLPRRVRRLPWTPATRYFNQDTAFQVAGKTGASIPLMSATGIKAQRRAFVCRAAFRVPARPAWHASRTVEARCFAFRLKTRDVGHAGTRACHAMVGEASTVQLCPCSPVMSRGTLHRNILPPGVQDD
jgi:hypothetical protein